MGSYTQEITVEQSGQESTETASRDASGTQVSSPSHGSVAQIGSVRNPYDVLNRLTRILSPTNSLDTLLHSLTEFVRQQMSMDLCVALLVDPAHDTLTLQAATPNLNEYELNLTPIESDRIPWKKLEVLNLEGQLPILTMRELEQLNPLQQVQHETLLAIPLVVSNDYLGLMICYSTKSRDYTPDDQALLRCIANQASLAIQNRQLVCTPASRNSVKAFFDDLLSAKPDQEESLRGRANYLGYDLTQPHILLMLAMVRLSEPVDAAGSQEQAISLPRVPLLQTNGPTNNEENLSAEIRQEAYTHTAGFMKQRVQEHYPGSLVDARENVLFCAIPSRRSADLQTWLRDLIQQVQREQHFHLFAGIGNPYLELYDYRKGFAEAEAALRIGQHLKHEDRITHFNDLGIYRYIYEFVCSNTLDDSYLEKIAAIISYDQQRKGSELLDTLEVFLETGGNIKDTAKRLRVHRNTINQRIKHIQCLCAVNLDRPQQQLRLHVALMIHTLRRNQASFCLRSDKTIST